jgi:hypothetical protein
MVQANDMVGAPAVATRPEEGEILTPKTLRAWLDVGEDWVEKNTQKRLIPGMFKAGKYWRYRKVDIEKNILKTGQALLKTPARKA